jgi:hypothetical protein
MVQTIDMGLLATVVARHAAGRRRGTASPGCWQTPRRPASERSPHGAPPVPVAWHAPSACPAGKLRGSAGRLAHFLQLQQEARAYERRRDARLRRVDERAWGKLAEEAHRQMRRKRGE